MGKNHIDTDHLLLALIDNALNKRFPEGHAVAQVLEAFNVDLSALEQRVIDLKDTNIFRVHEKPGTERVFSTEVVDVNVRELAGSDLLCVRVTTTDENRFEFELEQGFAAKLLSELAHFVVADETDISNTNTEK